MEEAHSEFDADLTALQSELRASRRVALDGIGTLYLTASGVVKLVSDCNLFNALPIFALAPAEEEIIPVEATVMAEEKNPDYYYIPIPKKLTKIAACFLLAATVCLVALLPVNSWQKGVSTAAIAPITVEKTETIVNTDIPSAKPSAVATDNNEAATINESATSAQLRDEVEQPNPISAPADAAEESVVNNDEKYFVIVAAFKSQNEVDKFKAEHSKDSNRIQVIKNGTFNLIAVSSASQRADLDSQLPLIRSFYPEAWVYTKK